MTESVPTASEFAHMARRVNRAAKGASAALSAMADACQELHITTQVERVRRSGDALPPSWEGERHDFLRRLMRGDA